MALPASDVQETTEDTMPEERFRSKEAYRKNLAYRHINGIPMRAKTVVVGRKRHTVKHSGKKRRTKKKIQRKRA